jgi:hypothetical protein
MALGRMLRLVIGAAAVTSALLTKWRIVAQGAGRGVLRGAGKREGAELVDDVEGAGSIRDRVGEGRVDREGAGDLVDGEAVLHRDRDRQDEL